MLSIKILLMSLFLTNAVITDLQKSRVRSIVQIFSLPYYTINFFESMYESAYHSAGNDIDNINRDIVAYNTVYYAAQAFQIGHNEGFAMGNAVGHDQRRAQGQPQTDDHCVPAIQEESI